LKEQKLKRKIEIDINQFITNLPLRKANKIKAEKKSRKAHKKQSLCI
jgi:hypothetical protein